MQANPFTGLFFRSAGKRKVEKIHREFCETRGYGSYHDHCRQQSGRDLEPGGGALLAQGFEKVPIMPAEEASILLDQVLTRSTGETRSNGGDYLDILELDDPAFMQDVLARIINDEIDQKIAAYFKSEYFIYWHILSRANVGHVTRRSYCWHCDKGPQNHLKILFFLNGSDEHGGNTEFLDRPCTDGFENTGYLFCPVKSRTSDLSELAHKHGIDYKPQRPDIKAGEAYLFEPTNVLHRGILPTMGPRYILTICLLPSPTPWREVFRKNSAPISPDFRWHADAHDLLPFVEKMAVGPP